MSRYSGRIAIVTGGSSGIGEAAVRAYFAEGATVIIADANQQRADWLADELKEPSRVWSVGVDVSDRAAINAMVAEVEQRFGVPNCLVNCAAIRGVADVASVEPEQWKRVHEVNVEGTLYALQAFVRSVRNAGRAGSIVNITSVGGLMGVPNRAAYVSSKHAIVGITRELAIEVGASNIRVNAIAPGFIRTRMTESMFRDAETAKGIERAHPLGRAGRPEEIAAAILFLTSDEASFITGAILSVDGGYTAGKGW